MIAFDGLSKRIKANEREALFFMEFNDLDYAEKLLLENLNEKTNSVLTYDLLIRIYHKKNDLSSMLRLLNSAIQYTDKKEFYRRLRKQIIIFMIFNDLEKIDA